MAQPLSLVLRRLAVNPSFRARLALWHTQPAREAILADPPLWLHGDLRKALAKRGIARLYSHQGQAVESARMARAVLIATPTASGKSLCFHLPVLQSFLREPGSTALYLFPTKALARQQEEDLRRWVAALPRAGSHGVYAYDGDSPPEERRAARERAVALFTNPEMLHAGLLPAHARWHRFWSGLSFVIIDEIHTYGGMTAAHLANLLRRLKRVAAAHGAAPRFLAASATLGDPRALAKLLLGEEAKVVTASGAPGGIRHFLIYDATADHGNTPEEQAARLAFLFLREGIPAVIFARSRDACEVMAARLSGFMASTPFGAGAVAAYRAGYLPHSRRRLEERLASGTLLGVVATSALEVGIDAGHISVSIMAGHPGNGASLWQQAGRAGRRGQESAAILVAGTSPPDRFAVANPEAILNGNAASAPFDPDYEYVSDLHLLCAAGELPLSAGERWGPMKAHERAAVLEGRGLLRRRRGGWYPKEERPWQRVNIRAQTTRRVTILMAGRPPRLLGEAGFDPALLRLVPGAPYRHAGSSYRVVSADFAAGYLIVVPSPLMPAGAPRPRIHRTVLPGRILTGQAIPWSSGRPGLGGTAFISLQEVTLRWSASGPPAGVYMDLPVQALRITFPPGRTHPDQMAVLTGLGRLIQSAGACHLQCDGRDLTLMVEQATPPAGRPALTIYEHPPGGTGLVTSFFNEMGRVTRAAAVLARTCPCLSGCPACIGSPPPGSPAVRIKKEASEMSGRLAKGLGICRGS